MQLWSPSEGNKRIDILEFEAGKGNPYADEGQWHFERTYFVHRNIGPQDSAYICLKKTYGKRCPICDAIAEMSKDPNVDDDTRKALLPKERQLWQIYDHAEEDKGVQLWDVSHHLFGKLLDKRIKLSDDDEDYEFFADQDEGMTLKIAFSEESRGGYKFLEASSIDFKARGPIPDEIMEQVVCLDDLLLPLSYDKLEAVYLHVDADEDDGDDEPKKPKSKSKSRKPPKEEEPEDEDNDLDDEDEGDDPPPKSKSKSKSRKPPKEEEPEDDDDDGGGWGDDSDDFEDDDGDDPPPRKSKPKSKSKSKKSPTKSSAADDDDDDDDIPF